MATPPRAALAPAAPPAAAPRPSGTRGAVSPRIRYDNRRPPVPGPGRGLPAGRPPPPRWRAQGGGAAAPRRAPAPRCRGGRGRRVGARRPPQRLPPRPGTSSLTAGAQGKAGGKKEEEAASRYLRIALSTGSALLRAVPARPGPSSSWRPPPSPAPGNPPAPRSPPCAASGRLRKMAALPGQTTAGLRWRGRGGAPALPGRPAPRAPPHTAPLQPPRRRRDPPRAPRPPPGLPRLLTFSALVRGAPPPLGLAQPGRARDGGGGGAGCRGGAAALLPDAAVHGGAGAAARVPPALVPPHRRRRAAGGAAAAGAQPRGKAGAAGRDGTGGAGTGPAAVPHRDRACSWWRRRTCAPWSPSTRSTRPASSAAPPR